MQETKHQVRTEESEGIQSLRVQPTQVDREEQGRPISTGTLKEGVRGLRAIQWSNSR